MILPNKLTANSRINFVHTSSPVSKADMKDFQLTIKKMEQNYRYVRVYDVERKELDPRYLAASEGERLAKFRLALKKANWLMPVYGGTGCGDIIRYLRKFDLTRFRLNHPIVNGFSDTTFLLNYLYFKIKLLTFHYANGCGLFSQSNHKQFFDIISGKVTKYSYKRPAYEWLSPNKGPKKVIEGIAIGGNLTTFRDLLDITRIVPSSWENYVLFIEDIDLDMEDLHRLLIALDHRGIFMYCKAVVIGRMNEKSFNSSWSKLNNMFGPKKQVDHLFEYLISDVIEERMDEKDKDPLYILKVDNFGHGVFNDHMILPIGGKVRLHPDGTVEFVGPFVK
ncbi:TPA: hypothetical protein DF272_00765 [Candidatus Falkowbacteria bacterium]|nr:hypothetical protein [Candidatus Falkowbacteria bacterium]